MSGAPDIAAEAGPLEPEPVVACLANGRPSLTYSITFHQPGGRLCISLDELDRQARRVALHLKRLGIRPGDRIGILARNRLEWVLLDLAALKIKAVTAGFEAGKVETTPDLIDRYGLSLLFTDQQPGDRWRGDPRIHPIARLLADIEGIPDNPDLPPVTYDPDDVTTIKFTSGSTGQPKGLAARAGSIDGSLSAVQALFRHRPIDRLFVFLPLSLLQQRYWIYSALAFGHNVVVATYEMAFHALRREEPTVVMGVPAFFEALRKDIESRITGRDGGGSAQAASNRAAVARTVLGSHIRYLWTGSAPASPGLLAFFESCGLPIFEGYGMNETCIVTKNTPAAHRTGSVGRPVPGKRVTLDKDGVIIVHSDQPVNSAYLFAAPGESERLFLPDGGVRTGDLGRIDADGYLYILGRVDDIVVLENGRNVLARPLEERLRTCPAVTDGVIVGAGCGTLQAIVCASGGEADRGVIEQHIALMNRDAGRDERIGGLVIADEPFSIENGLLTSQYKPRRNAILARYGRALAPTKGDEL